MPDSRYLIYDLFQYPGNVVVFCDGAGVVCDDFIVHINDELVNIFNWISLQHEPKITDSKKIKVIGLRRFPNRFCEITILFEDVTFINIPSNDIDEFFSMPMPPVLLHSTVCGLKVIVNVCTTIWFLKIVKDAIQHN